MTLNKTIPILRNSLSIDQYWAAYFGVPPAALGTPGRHVVPHEGLSDYHGAWVFTRQQTVIVSVPLALLNRVQLVLERGPWPDLSDEIEWRCIFSTPVARVIGPAYDGYLRETVDAKSPHIVRRLTQADFSAFQRLSACCVGDEWDHASIDPQNPEPIFGCFADGELAAVAQNQPMTNAAVSPGIFTAPSFRSRGIGAAVLAATMEDASNSGRLILYQTLLSNLSAVRLGESLGVVQYATHMAYRFAITSGDE